MIKKILSSFISLAVLAVMFVIDPTPAKAAFAISTSSLPNATVGQPYSTKIQVSGGVAPYTWSTLSTTYISGCCALGLNGNSSPIYDPEITFNTQSSPTVLDYTGTYYWTFQVTDGSGATATKTLSLTINPAPQPNPQPILIVSSSFAAFNYQIGGSVPSDLSLTISNNSTSQIINYTISVPNQPSWLNTAYNTNTLSLNPLQSAGVGISINPTNLSAGTYTTTIYFTGNFFNSPASIVITLNVSNAPGSGSQNIVSGPAHPNNTNILGPDGTVYLIQNGFRSPYTSAGAFLSYGFNYWANVAPATTGDMNLPLSTYTPSGSTSTTTYFITPRNGSLINDKGTIYLITNGLRIGFASADAFLGLGYSYATVQPGDTSFMVALAPINNSAMSHPDGTLVNDNGTIYIMKNNTKMGFPSLQVFFSWGFELNKVVPANSYDRGAPVSGLVNTRMANQLSI